MVTKEQVEQYFLKHRQEIDIIKLLHYFEVSKKDTSTFLDILVELEKKGKILLTENNKYLPVSSDFYLKNGVVKKSNRGNYYIDLGKGRRINITHVNQDINRGDSVFVEKIMPAKSIHIKYQEGTVIRKIEKPNLSTNTILKKAIVERESSSSQLYVKVENDKIYLKKSGCNSAYPGDTVTVLVSEYDNNTKAEVKEVINRKQDSHVFECRIKNGMKYWAPIGTEFFEIIQKPAENLEVGTRVIANIKEKVASSYNIEILDRITSLSPLELEIKSALSEHHFDYDFLNNIIEESKQIKPKEKSNSNERVDLRGLETFTIDSLNAKDLDDAISLEKIGTHYRLYVHIADVSSYIKPDNIIYEEALKRTTSIYMANYVVPMLPSKLSNEMCSLNPDEDRLTKTCMMDIDENGKVINFEIYKSIIRSDCKMSYDKVDALLTGKEIDPSYLPFYKTLMNMYQLAQILQKKRYDRGDFCLQIDEVIVNTDEYDNPLALENRFFGPSAMMIENFMLLANITVADYAYWLELPFVYRNHDTPLRSKAKNIEHMILDMNPNERECKNIQNSKYLQQKIYSILNGKNIEEKKQISKIFLKNFMHAYYSEEPLGHYGLSLDRYATFTSPIRHAPDLLNHTFLDQVLCNEPPRNLSAIKEKLKEICKYLSDRQKEAETVEKEIDFYLIKQYAEKYVNHPLHAKINYMDEEGLYIKTENTIPGFIPTNKNYFYQKEHHTFYDAKEKNIYHTGDDIEVVIKSSTCKDYSILFEPYSEKEHSPKVLNKKK